MATQDRREAAGLKYAIHSRLGREQAGTPRRLSLAARAGRCICEKLAKDFGRVFLSGCMLPLLNGWLRGGLSMRHKPRLDGYTAGIIGLGLLPIAMAFAAVLIP